MKTILILIIIVLCIIIFVLINKSRNQKRVISRYIELEKNTNKYQVSGIKELYEKRLVFSYLFAILTPGKSYRIKYINHTFVISELFKKDTDKIIDLSKISVDEPKCVAEVPNNKS